MAVGERVEDRVAGADAVYRVNPWQDEDRRVEVVLVGCGGTGGFMADALGRMAWRAREQQQAPWRLRFVDFDAFERHNLTRQDAGERDVGRAKAAVTAERVRARYDLPVEYAVGRWACYSPAPASPREAEFRSPADWFGSAVGSDYRALKILIGAVDNRAARAELARYVALQAGRVWWVDCGNDRDTGQVLVGNCAAVDGLYGAFVPEAGVARGAPAPSLVLPELVAGAAEVLGPDDDRLSCVQRIAQDGQSPAVNEATAALAADTVWRLTQGALDRFGVFYSLAEGTMQALRLTPEAVWRALRGSVDDDLAVACRALTTPRPERARTY
jgi:hypothetical protein